MLSIKDLVRAHGEYAVGRTLTLKTGPDVLIDCIRDEHLFRVVSITVPSNKVSVSCLYCSSSDVFLVSPSRIISQLMPVTSPAKENLMFDVVVVQVINGYIGQVHAEIPGSAMVIVWQSIPFAPGDDVEDSCQGRQFAEIAANNAIAAAMSTMFVDIGTTSK